jgi:hypothetical protein
MKQYLPLAIGLVLLATNPVQAKDGLSVDVNAGAQTGLTTATPANTQVENSAQTTVDTKTTESTQQESSTVQQSTEAGTQTETDAKAAPVMESQPSTGNATADDASKTETEVKTSESTTTETKAVTAPNVQKLFKFFHSSEKQADAEAGKKDVSTPPSTQAPQ